MEGVGAAASLITLIHLTIKGVEIIQRAAISIKDGPQTIQFVARNATNLLYILQQLETSPIIKGEHNLRLRELIAECQRDVTVMVQKLEAAAVKESDCIRDKIYKSFKYAIDEKRWKEFQSKLQNYSNSINSFLAVEDRLVPHRINCRMCSMMTL
jgi:hypothetical protein